MTYFLFPSTVTATDRDCTVLNFSRWNKHTFYFIVTEKYCYIVYMADQSNETGIEQAQSSIRMATELGKWRLGTRFELNDLHAAH